MLTLGINTWTPEMDVWWGLMCVSVLVFLGDWGRGRREPPASSQTDNEVSQKSALSFLPHETYSHKHTCTLTDVDIMLVIYC